MKHTALVLALTAGLLSNASWADDMVVVVNVKNPITKLSSDDVSQLFMGQTESYPGGAPAKPIDQPENSAQRAQFDSKVLGKTPNQMHAYWSKMVFTGKGKPLKEMATAKDVKDYLASDPTAIGYMEKSEVDGTVRVVYSF